MSEAQPAAPEVTPEQERHETEAAFEAVGAKEPVDKQPADSAQESAPIPEIDKPSEQAEAIEKPDPWEGVPPIVRQTLEGISAKLGAVDALSQDIKTTAGRVAAIQSGLATAKATAKTMENAPTAAQIDAAAKDPEEWAELKREFPEWTTATEGYIKQALAAERADLLKQIPKAEAVDVDGLRRDVDVTVGDAMNRARQLARVDLKYPTWEQDVRAPDGNLNAGFAAWMKTQTPEIQALADSVKADDAIKMLDMYYDHLKAQAAHQKKQQRLEAAIPARGTSGQRQPTQSERDAAEQAFASV